jgi:hypothetical protein
MAFKKDGFAAARARPPLSPMIAKGQSVVCGIRRFVLQDRGHFVQSYKSWERTSGWQDTTFKLVLLTRVLVGSIIAPSI